jgi:hypothetical protein
MIDLLETLEQEHNTERLTMKLQWEGVKLQAEKEKLEHPELTEQIDNYLKTIKATLYNFLIELADDEEEKQELLTDAKYIFGEDINDL